MLSSTAAHELFKNVPGIGLQSQHRIGDTTLGDIMKRMIGDLILLLMYLSICPINNLL